MNDIRTAQYQAKLLYNVDLKDDDFEELALIALQRIGNKHTQLQKIKEYVGESLEINLPCNCDRIEAITFDYEDPYYTSNIYNNGDSFKTQTENYIEQRKVYQNPYYINGKFAKYTKVGDKLKFDKQYGPINILYHEQLMGEDDLPLVNDKEIDAIAAFCAYYSLYRKGLSSANPNLIKLADTIDWKVKIDEARTPEYLDQNDADNILNVITSHDRKIYNKSYKPIK